LTKCRSCGVPLTEDNWYQSYRRKRMHLCITCARAQTKAFQKSHPDEVRRYARKYRRKRHIKDRLSVMLHYGGSPPHCANPFGQHVEPYTDDRALSIDHIEGGGHRHKKLLRRVDLYRWLVENNFPSGFQVLCMNCQFIKMKVRGEKPKFVERALPPQERGQATLA
jgi:hypothetical protein